MMELEAPKQELTVLERYANVDVERYDLYNSDTAIDPIGPIVPIDVYVALTAAKGNYSTAAQYLNRPRDTLVRWIKANPEFARIADNFTEAVLDDAETILHDQVRAGEKDQIRYLLSTRGKGRGYTTKTETAGHLAIEMQFSKIVQERMSEEQILAMAQEIMESQSVEANTIDGTFADAEEE